MFLAYIDDSGNPELKADKRVIVLSAVLIHESNLTMMKNAVDEYKKNNFKGQYSQTEIHTHDIYKANEKFYGISNSERDFLLDELYKLIKKLPMTIIISAIKKQDIQSMTIDVSKYMWTFLIERINGFLEKDEVRIKECSG